MNNIIDSLKNLELATIDNIQSAKSNNTIRAYKSDFRDYNDFCSKHKINTKINNLKNISLYLTYLSNKKIKFSTIKRKLVSLVMIYRLKGDHIDTKNPLIAENLKSIKKKIGGFQKSKKAISLKKIKEIINFIENSNMSLKKKLRDKAILLIGFTGGFRRSELVSINIEDLDFVEEGLKINLKKSKTDQFSEGFIKAIPYSKNKNYCPVKILKNWIKISKISYGAIFRKFSKSGNLLNRLSDQSIALILKNYLLLIGENSDLYSAHSLRSGFATAAAESGVEERSIMSMTGHKSSQMVRRYIQESNLFKNNPLNKMNL